MCCPKFVGADSLRAYYTRVVGPPCAVAVVALLMSAGFGSAPAASPDSPVRIDCAALDRENRGALEARARAEIAVQPQPAGTMTVACSSGGADVEWTPSGGYAVRKQTVSLEGDQGLAVDRLLDTMHALRFAADDAPGASAAPVPIVAGGAHRSARPFRFGVVAAARGELWQGAIPGAVDGQLGVRFATRTGWSLTAGGALGRGLGPGQGLDVQTMRASLGLGRALSARLELALGGEWRRLVASQPGALGSREQSGDTFGAFAAIRYVVAQGPFSLAVGPDVIVLARPIAVDVLTGEVFRLPRLVIGLSVTGAADILR